MSRTLLCVLVALFGAPARGDDIHVAVAANFIAPMREIAAAFEAYSGHRAVLSVGASGRFYAQIKQGAPYQIFLSADQHKPAELERDGLVVKGSGFTYALGRLVLWSARAPDPLAQLQQGRYHKLALANARVAPYGEAAVDVLKALNLQASSMSRWVKGENINQTWQFVASGNADLGFVAASQLAQRPVRDVSTKWLVPATLHRPLRQDAVLLNSGRDSAPAKALLAYLRSEAALTIIQRYGYSLPDEAERRS